MVLGENSYYGYSCRYSWSSGLNRYGNGMYYSLRRAAFPPRWNKNRWKWKHSNGWTSSGRNSRHDAAYSYAYHRIMNSRNGGHHQSPNGIRG